MILMQERPHVGANLREAREMVGMTQRDLAQVSDLSQPTIQRIEAGIREPSLLELSSLAFGCGVSVDDLRGTSSIHEEVLVAGRTDDAGATELAAYLTYALGVARELDEMGIPRNV